MNRCLHHWPAGKNFDQDHTCWEPQGHEPPHRCICGYTPDETDKDNSKPDAKSEAKS